MRSHIINATLLVAATVPLLGQAAAAPTPTADDVIAQMFLRDTQRESAADGYSGERQYDLENERFNKHARMMVSVTCGPDGTKRLGVVSEEGWKSANDRVFRKMLESEAEASLPFTRRKAQITSENYIFRMIGIVSIEGRPTYEIDVVPRRQDTLLFRGHIWVDAEDDALVRVEGEPAKNPSFWIRSVHFTQENHKNGAFWFPLSTTSVTDARIFGRTKLDIHYFNYAPRSETAQGFARPAPKEGSYAEN